jgi:hypothetical protein
VIYTVSNLFYPIVITSAYLVGAIILASIKHKKGTVNNYFNHRGMLILIVTYAIFID